MVAAGETVKTFPVLAVTVRVSAALGVASAEMVIDPVAGKSRAFANVIVVSLIETATASVEVTGLASVAVSVSSTAALLTSSVVILCFKYTRC